MQRGFFVPNGRGAPYGRRRDPYREQYILRLLLALGQQVMMMERKPPVTLAIAAVNVLFYLQPQGIDFVPTIRSGCLQPSAIVNKGQWDRLLWAPFLHADEAHLYYNMASLLYKGSMLEPSMGSLPFAALIAELMLTSSLFYILTAAAVASRARPQGLLGVLGLVSGGRLWQSCAVGFSGVLFGLKVVLNSGSPGWSQIAGVRVPTKYAAWAELVLVQLISPNVSFVGHLCGIAAGLVHVHVTRRLLRWRWGAWGAGSGGRGGGRGRTYGRGTWGG